MKITQSIAIVTILMAMGFSSCTAQQPRTVTNHDVIVGAQRFSQYLPLLKGKKVALVGNQTSEIQGIHLVDTLLAQHVDIQYIFCPEHGFRGEAQAGDAITNGKDAKTGIPIISLYGRNKKPDLTILSKIDIMLFDLQDVGARFYTYISTMTYIMEACSDAGIPIIILDRPNPNGYYVDGPVLDAAFSSFVGMHSIPMVHGMTVGEYAMMITGEGWLHTDKKCNLTVITCTNWDHSYRYQLPIKPSPNLPDMKAVYLYPSLCLFEGTVVSIGRGTLKPFRQFGHPMFSETEYSFTPVSIPGASTHPKHENKTCNGYLLDNDAERIKQQGRINLSYLIQAWELIGDSTFFTPFFEKLAGTNKLRRQIMDGLNEETIRDSWQEDLDEFKKTRSKYLLYKDF